MTDFRPSADTLAAALKRVENYVSYLPPSVARDVREALKEYEMAIAETAIVQKPGVKPYCHHSEYIKLEGICTGCGEKV